MGRKFTDKTDNVQQMMMDNQDLKQVLGITDSDIAKADNDKCLQWLEKYNKQIAILLKQIMINVCNG